MLLRRLLACLALSALSAGATERLKLNFDPEWRFLKSDPGEGAAAPSFDDSAWSVVSAPHTYNDVDTFTHFSNRGMSGEKDQWGGRTWYRKHFVLPASLKGRKVYVEFEGVRQVGEVYLNGVRLGVGKNGFVPFGFELTAGLHFDGTPNVLAVMCDNRFMTDPVGETNLGKMSAMVNASVPEDVDQIQANQIPWNNPRWHPPHGGIYRNVFVYAVDPLHISLPLYEFLKTEGPYVYATEVSDASARITLEIPIENARSSESAATVQVDVLDAAGKHVLLVKQAQRIAAGGAARVQLSGKIDIPQLWEPGYPYLYQVVCTVLVDGKPVDSTTIPFGIRTARFTTNVGFFINGHYLKLHGWGQRPTDEWPGLGAAQPDWLHYYTLFSSWQAGSNFERWGHSAGGPVMITAADQLGLITDQPGVDGESDTVGAAWKIRAAAFRDLIIYYRNHPSILIWEAGNQKVTLAHAKELREIFQTYDPHGGRAEAYRRADQTDAKWMDVGIGTEGGREIASLPVVEGEYDREESPRRVWDDASPPRFGYPEAKGQTYDLTSEQYAVNQVAQFMRKIGSSLSHCGGANWVFSDTTSGGRVDAETARDSGEVDGVRLYKEAYFVCQAMFRSDPEVHIIGHWNYPAGTKKTVYVASNGDEVELRVNGKSLGRGKVSDRFLFTFPDVVWQPGQVQAIATRKGQPWTSETLHTAGAPARLKLSVINCPGGLRADGSDVALIDVEAVDAHGQRCPTFEQRVDFECTGPATWRGGWNSGKPNSINRLYLDLECGINRVAVRAGLTAGEIVVKARSAGLSSSAARIRSVAFPLTDGYSERLPALPSIPLPKVKPVHVAADRYEALAARVAKMPAGPPQPGKVIRSFSYSGPTSIAHVESGAQDGKNVYVDKDTSFEGLPAALRGADWVQAGNGDALFSALDFVVVGVPAGASVFVAHDDGLPLPGWLRQLFEPTEMKLSVGNRPMTVFRHRAAQDETLTFGSNTEDPAIKTGNMYVVFVKAPSGRSGKKKSQ